MPISRVRCVTKYDRTPKTPMLASVIARPANVPSRIVRKRGSDTASDASAAIDCTSFSDMSGSIAATWARAEDGERARRHLPADDEVDPA